MLTPLRKQSDYHHGDLRHASISAARNLVSENGLTSLGIRKVAERIGVSPAALYRHFENLEQLRAEVSSQVRTEIGQFMLARRDRAVKSSSRRKTVINRFEALGIGYVEYARTNPRLFEIAFLSCDEEAKGMEGDLAWRVLREGIQELEDSGLLNGRAKAMAPMLAWSAVHGFASLVVQEGIPKKAYSRSLTDVLQGVQRALFS